MSGESTQQRQARIFGARKLARLRRSEIGVVGVGLLGGWFSLHAGMLHVGQLLIDPDVVEAPNLGNQAFPADRLGAPKVTARAEQLQALAPGARVRTLQARVEDIGLGWFADLDLIVTGLDSRVSRMRVAEISQQLGLPWLDLACDGSGKRLQGTVSYWDPRIADAPCHLCRYDADQLDTIRREGRGPGCPSWAKPAAPITPPTLMASTFGSVISGFGAAFGVRSLLGEAEEIANTQLQIFGDGAPTTRTISLARSPHCTLPHLGLGVLVRVPAGTIGELFAHATRELGTEPETLRFHHRQFLPELYCPTEGRRWDFPRLSDSIHPKELECGCHRGARRVPTQLAGHLTRKDVERFGALRWAAIGLPQRDVVTATAGDSEIHCIVGGA